MKRINEISTLLIVIGFISLFSAVMHGIFNDERWFSRMFLAVVCFGFYALIKKEK